MKRSVQEGEGSVNTQTGSVRVAASQSNIVETEPLQFVTDSVSQRGNRNKARLIREKREALRRHVHLILRTVTNATLPYEGG